MAIDNQCLLQKYEQKINEYKENRNKKHHSKTIILIYNLV